MEVFGLWLWMVVAGGGSSRVYSGWVPQDYVFQTKEACEHAAILLRTKNDDKIMPHQCISLGKKG